jgi:phosphoglycerate dehydrogenase-like enzyme
MRGFRNAAKHRFLPLDQLLKQADVVSLHVPLTKETHHLLSTEQFALMKKNGVCD